MGPNHKNIPPKICVICERPFTWRKKWEKCWEEIQTCSDHCRNERKRLAKQAQNRGKHCESEKATEVASDIPTSFSKSEKKHSKRKNLEATCEEGESRTSPLALPCSIIADVDLAKCKDFDLEAESPRSIASNPADILGGVEKLSDVNRATFTISPVSTTTPSPLYGYGTYRDQLKSCCPGRVKASVREGVHRKKTKEKQSRQQQRALKGVGAWHDGGDEYVGMFDGICEDGRFSDEIIEEDYEEEKDEVDNEEENGEMEEEGNDSRDDYKKFVDEEDYDGCSTPPTIPSLNLLDEAEHKVPTREAAKKKWGVEKEDNNKEEKSEKKKLTREEKKALKALEREEKRMEKFRQQLAIA